MSSTRSRRRTITIPGPDLEKIRAPLLAINSADDLINPPELGILEREIKRVPKGRAIVIPLSDKTWARKIAAMESQPYDGGLVEGSAGGFAKRSRP